jgi:hypothetical protein
MESRNTDFCTNNEKIIADDYEAALYMETPTSSLRARTVYSEGNRQCF